jgi:hypothetical protein
MKLSLSFTFSKILPIYRPKMPNKRIVTHERNQIDIIRLVKPLAVIVPEK